MRTNIDQVVTISPSVWPGKQLVVQPGDLKQFMPLGLGINAPMPMMPWDDFSQVLQRGDYYAFQARKNHPFLDAPLTSACGGVVYFDGSPERADVDSLLRLLGVHANTRDFAVFVGHAETPREEGFLVQLRLVSGISMKYTFGALGEESLPEQPVSLGELAWKFIEDQQALYGGGYSVKLEGSMGGDGDWAREQLAFGFMVENDYHAVYRLWSRAWLVTK